MSRSKYYQRRKQGAQRTLALERQAIIERAEGFVHQLQCDLSRLDTALANVVVILAELGIPPRGFSISFLHLGCEHLGRVICINSQNLREVTAPPSIMRLLANVSESA